MILATEDQMSLVSRADWFWKSTRYLKAIETVEPRFERSTPDNTTPAHFDAGQFSVADGRIHRRAPKTC
jgi:hypothetical protein